MTPKPKSPASPVPKPGASQVPPHPHPDDPQHGEWLIDEGDDESFPASDPQSITQPHRKPRKK
jgi:hypothetical protein